MERMTALGTMEDYNRLLHSTDDGSGGENVARRSRCVLAATWVLVALGLLLCAGRESGAQQPAEAPEPAGPASSQQAEGRGPESAPAAEPKPARGEPANEKPASPPAERPTHHEPAGASHADHGAPAAESKPAPEEKVDQGPVSQPEHQQPAGQGTPPGQPSHGQGKPEEPPGRQTSAPHKPEHAPREHPRGPSPQKPVEQDGVRPHPPKPVDGGPAPRPEHQQHAPRPKPPEHPQATPDPSRGDEGGSRPEGAGSQGQQGESGVPPGKENPHSGENSGSVEPPQRSGPPSGHETGTNQGTEGEQSHVPTTAGKGSEGQESHAPIAAGKGSGSEENPAPTTVGKGSGGQESHVPIAVGKGSEGEQVHVPTTVANGSEGVGSGYEDATANAPSGTGQDRPSHPAVAPSTPGGPPLGTETGQDPDRRSALLAAREPGSGTRLAREPSGLPEKASVGVSAPRFTAVRGNVPVKLAGVPSSGLPDQRQVAKPSRTVETVPTAPVGGERRSAGYRGQPAAGPPFGSTEFFFSYLWDESGYPVQKVQDELGSMRGGARGFVTETPSGGALTQRGPPLQIPSPFSGFGLMMGGAASGASSSGVGGDPLLAVIFCCLFAVLWPGRSRAYGALLRAGTVPRLALERPG